MAGVFGIGGNTRTSQHTYETTNTQLGGQVQTGSVSNVSQPINIDITGKYAGSKSTFNLSQTDHGAVQAGAELGQLAVLANTSIAERAIAGAGFGLDIANQAIEASDAAGKRVTEFSLDALVKALGFGSDSLKRSSDIVGGAIDSSLAFGGDTFNKALNYSEATIDKALEFSGDQADKAFEISSSAQAGYERLARESLASSYQVARESMAAASAGVNAANDANARSLQFAENYSRSDSADTLNNIVKYGAWALIAVGVAFAFRGGIKL